MEQTNTPEVSQEEQAHNEQVQEHANGKESGGLPSSESETPKPDMFNGMSDEWKDENLKDGKLFGKFDSLEAMANSYKKLNDEKAQSGSNAKADAENLSREENRASVENVQLGDIANNGFNITEDNFQAFEDAGMTRAEAELSVLRMEKAANTAYGMVGGKDNYNELMTWASDNLNEKQIKAFASETIGDNFTIKPSGEFAIRGLQSMMRESGGHQQSSGRIQGNTASNNKQVSGFASKADYNAAMNYLRSNPRDTSAQREYDHKMSLTNMNNLR